MHHRTAIAHPATGGPARLGDSASRPLRPCLAIEVEGLRKSFDGHAAVDGLDLTVAEGTVVALVGPNGSGKTTTVRILSTLLAPDAGTVSVAGQDVLRHPELVRSVIGVTGQFSAVDNLLTGRENLMLVARLYHLAREQADERGAALLERFELTEAADRLTATYSGGMRRRLDLAMTLMGDPRIIFLDEPTTGLDPRSRRVLWQIVRDLVTTGVTILLTTQYLEEADELADQVAVLNHGRLVAHGPPRRAQEPSPGWLGTTGLCRRTISRPRRHACSTWRCEERAASSLQLATDGSVEAVRAVLERLEHGAVEVAGLVVQPPNLDDVFFALTGPAPGGDRRDEEAQR